MQFYDFYRVSEFKHNFAYQHVVKISQYLDFLWSVAVTPFGKIQFHSSSYSLRPFFFGFLDWYSKCTYCEKHIFCATYYFFFLSYRCMCVKIAGIQLRSPKFIICIWKTTIPLVRLFINFMTRGISSLQMQTLLTCYFKWTLKITNNERGRTKNTWRFEE